MVIKNKKLIVGSWINTASPVAAEIMSAAGFDFLVVDAEHSAVDISQAQSLFQAIKAGNPNCTTIIRLPGNQYSETKRYLDAGAMGVLVPLVNTMEEAEEVVRSVKYPPLGERGVGFGRSHGYGFQFDEYMSRANDDIFICIQIEHIRGVENLDKILSVKGIDAVFIGPYDLTASMGITAQFNHPKYLSTLNHILTKCKEFGVFAGIHVVQPDPQSVNDRVKEGFSMIGYSLDITMLGQSCRDGLALIKKDL